MENIEEIMDFIDCTGKQRRFKFETLESGPLMRLEAREIRNDKQPGYITSEKLAWLTIMLSFAVASTLRSRKVFQTIHSTEERRKRQVGDAYRGIGRLYGF